MEAGKCTVIVQTEATYSELNVGWTFRFWHFSNHRVIEVVLPVLQQIKPGSLFKVLDIVDFQVCQIW